MDAPRPLPPLVSLRDMRPAPRLTLGCPVLDGLLDGGVLTGGITEIVGEATAGKTQLALRLLLTAQLPSAAGGLDGAALYMYTEGGDPPLRRLAELAGSVAGIDPATAASRVYVERSVSDAPSLLAALERAAPLFDPTVTTPPVRLIVVDSVAALFRDAGAPDAADGGDGRAARAAYGGRATALFAVAAALKAVADARGAAVVAVNQVTDVVDGSPPPSHTAGLALVSSGRAVAPALGLAWASCVTTRLFLGRAAPVGAAGAADGSGVPRCLQVVFAPHLPPAWVRARVTGAGVVGVAEGEGDDENAAPAPPALATPAVCTGVFAE